MVVMGVVTPFYAPLSVAVAGTFSRTTSLAVLSSCSRNQTGCLMRHSSVQPWKTASQTNSGLTHVSGRENFFQEFLSPQQG